MHALILHADGRERSSFMPMGGNTAGAPPFDASFESRTLATPDIGSAAEFKPSLPAGTAPQHRPSPDVCAPPVVDEPMLLMVMP